jgi:ribosomal protein L21
MIRRSMYAIVRSGGKQLRVAAGDVVRIEKPAAEKISKGEKLVLSIRASGRAPTPSRA